MVQGDWQFVQTFPISTLVSPDTSHAQEESAWTSASPLQLVHFKVKISQVLQSGPQAKHCFPFAINPAVVGHEHVPFSYSSKFVSQVRHVVEEVVQVLQGDWHFTHFPFSMKCWLPTGQVHFPLPSGTPTGHVRHASSFINM